MRFWRGLSTFERTRILPSLERYLILLTAVVFAVGLTTINTSSHQRNQDDDPELRLRATPRVGFPPAEILFIAELQGGPDDNEELYCASVEWDWDDDTKSERIPDCDPFEPGASEIRRRFSQRHTFQNGDEYEVRLNLKRRGDVVLSGRTTIQVRGDIRGFR